MTDPVAAAPATPVAPTPTPAPVTSTLLKDWHWLTQHLVALVIVIVLTFGGIYFVESLVAKHDAANSAKYEQILAAQTQQTETLQKQLSTDEANWAQVEVQLLAQNAQLTHQISQRNQVVAVQVKADATLSAAQSAVRITQQTSAGPGEVVATGDAVTLDLPIARAITTDLDRLSLAQADLADTQTQLVNETQIATDAKADAANEKNLIAAQDVELADQKKYYTAQITTLNANARKGKLKWFGIGFIVGFVSGTTAHLW